MGFQSLGVLVLMLRAAVVSLVCMMGDLVWYFADRGSGMEILGLDFVCLSNYPYP
jgi:hypothetical protein